MSSLSKEQVMQLGDLLTIAVNSRDPNVKSMLNQLLIAVALIEDLEEIRAQNPIAAMIKEIADLKGQLADVKRSSQQQKVQKLVKDQYKNWYMSDWSGKDDF